MYLFDTPYLDHIDALNGTTPGLLGVANAAGGVYTFDASLTLHAHTPYFVYADTTTGVIGGTNGIEFTGGDSSPRYTGSNYYSGIPLTPGGSFANAFFMNQFSPMPGEDAAFKVSGVSAVPEPASLSLLFSGLAAIGCSALIQRKR